MNNAFLVGGNGRQQIHLNLRMGNRHGLIAGATGTGKTVTLQLLAEGFARAGVPVFMAGISLSRQPRQVVFKLMFHCYSGPVHAIIYRPGKQQPLV